MAGHVGITLPAFLILGETRMVCMIRSRGVAQRVSRSLHYDVATCETAASCLAQIEKVTQTNAASAEESAAASDELSSQAEKALRVVARLTTLVGGGRSQSPATTQSREARGGRPAMSSRSVVNLSAEPTARFTTRRSAEEHLPLEDGTGTGTYGRF